jgi:hypothetical protein
MLPHRTGVSNAAKADATHQALVAEQWRDWHMYLQSHLKLLDAQQAETSALPSFERQPTSWETQRELAEAALKRIPTARRVVFDREREHRREEVQRDLEQAQRTHGDARPTPIDADVIDRETLQSLLQEAEGRDSQSERGLVPMGDGRWYEVHVPSLMTVPNAADYSVGEFDDGSKRKRLVAVGALVLVLVVGMWLTWPRGSTVTTAAPEQAPMVNGETVQPWTIRSALLVAPNGSTTTLTVTATTAGTWPASPATTQPVAYWRSTTFMPLELCVQRPQLLATTRIRLRATAMLPERVYTLQATAPARYDLLLAACDAAGDRIVRYGTLTATTPLPVEEPGRTIALPDGRSLRLRTIRVVGPGQDTTLPSQQYRVLVEVETSADLDWSSLAPTLLLASGTAVLPGETVRVRDAVELRYLVRAWDAPTEAVWMIATEGDTHNHRWRTTLEPPPTRAAILQQRLRITTFSASAPPNGDEPRLSIDVQNVGAEPLQLTADDLAVSQGGSLLALPPVAALRRPLAAAEKRTIDIVLPGGTTDQPLVVAVGAERFSVRWR